MNFLSNGINLLLISPENKTQNFDEINVVVFFGLTLYKSMDFLQNSINTKDMLRVFILFF